MTFPLEDFDYLRDDPLPSVMQGDGYADILTNLDVNYAALEAGSGRFWVPGADDSIHHANENYAYREFVRNLFFDARWRAGHPLWAVGPDLRRAAQRNLIVPNTDEPDELLRRRIFRAEDKAPFGSFQYVRNLMTRASVSVINTGLVVTNNNQTFACYVLTNEVADGTPSANLLAIVQDSLTKAEGQHQSQTYTINEPVKVDYSVTAVIFYNPSNPDVLSENIMLTRARESLDETMAARRNLGYSMRVQDIEKALKITGVEYSTVSQPAGDLVPVNESTYYYGTGHTISIMSIT